MAEIQCFPMDPGGFAPAVNTIGGWLVTSWPGGRIDPIRGGRGQHGGVDLVAKVTLGAPFYAVCDGTITQSWDPSGGGNWTSLRCNNGDTWGYGHAKEFAPGARIRKVKAGDLLGYVGTSGGSTGPHMHAAQNVGSQGAWDDPVDVLRRCADRGAFPGRSGAPTPEQEEEEMTPAQMAELKAYIDTKTQFLSDRIEQAGTAGQAVTNAAIDNAVRDGGPIDVIVTRKRDELGAAIDANFGGK